MTRARTVKRKRTRKGTRLPAGFRIETYAAFLAAYRMILDAAGIRMVDVSRSMGIYDNTFGDYLRGTRVPWGPRLWDLVHAVGWQVAIRPERPGLGKTVLIRSWDDARMLLRKIIKARGLRQIDCAADVGMAVSQLNSYLCGRVVPRAPTVFRLLASFDRCMVIVPKPKDG